MSSVVIAEKSHFTRHRTRRLTRREKWPLHLAFILIYFLIHLISTSTTSPLNVGNLVSNTTTISSTMETAIKSSQLNSNQFENEKDKNNDKNKGLPPQDQVKGNNFNENTKSPESEKENEAKESEKTSKDNVIDDKTMGKENTEPDRKDKDEKSDGDEKISGKIPNSTTEPSIISTTSIPEHSTVRPKRKNCSAPAIEQFPRPLMGPSARKHGGLIIHIIVAVYTFLGLAIVCDDYFVSSLDRICEELRLSPDVAGATFMAAGSSAPELATVIIGVFFAQDDIGVSGVIGSAVFNIMFVISVCGLCTTTVSKLNWWPLCRDSFFYAVSILVMLGTIFNEIISWPEALFMLIMYVVYCVTLSYNASLERWAKSYDLPFLPKDEEPAEQSALVTYKSLQEERVSYTAPSSPTPVDPWKNPVDSALQAWDDPQQEQQMQQQPIQQQPQPQQQQQQQQQQQAQPAAAVAAKPQYYKAKEYDPNEVSPLEKPVDGTQFQIFSWALVYPIHYMCRFTMPDVRQEKYKRLYPYTFFMSMLWISFYSYIMVWMITIIGSTLGIPDTVMGLTFVAAGVSVPDALSSLAVIKEGLGDMAVSNAVGSNVFDILVCLGLPWFIQTAIIKPGSHVNVTSRGLTYSTLSLLSTVVFLVLATHMNGWKLDRRYGVVLMVWYLIFIVFASLYELNVFGQMNPPACPSLY